MERAADYLGPGLIEIVTFVDPPTCVCNFAEEGSSATRSRSYRPIVFAVGITLVFCRLGLPREDRAVPADRIDLLGVERRLYDQKGLLQFSRR